MKKIAIEKKIIQDMLDKFNSLLEQDPDNLDAISWRGLLYNLSERYDEAIDDFSQILKVSPNDVNAYLLRSDCYYNKGEYDLCKQDYIRGLKMQDGDQIDEATETFIQSSIIENENELRDIKKVLEYEKNEILSSYFSDLKE